MSHYDSKEICLCIHGHFYQPPRENAWLESIELQESASPFHDWNERIYHECYLPNAFARVLDDKGHIIDIVNNYEKMSFNFGPTLLSWMEQKHPDTYRRILDADRMSMKHHHGHGNALAQVYNHMIMPLANRRDKISQVRWGIEDFKSRFGREPEGMWLAETACNEETLEILVEEGIRFVVLAPHQAEAIRSLSNQDWVDVSSGQIDPKVPYRCFLNHSSEKYIDIFFYDGPISKDISFGDLSFDAHRLMSRIEEAVVRHYPGPQLLHLAVDGETFGHHKPFGERALAYLLTMEAPKRGFHIVNYGEFLDLCPPQFAVRIKAGEDNEGTAWSCMHGVKRWKEDCGCRTGGAPEWTQHWRKPLREALDGLRDELAKEYEKLGADYFKNVWDARNDYIHVILNRSLENVRNFLNRQAKRPLSDQEMIAALKLLEIQRNAMLMYTSCGWFFVELSGIETVQILQYASRAIQLMSEMKDHGHSIPLDLEEKFLEKLSHAKSNIPQFRNGKLIYEKFVRPAVVTFQDMVSHFAIDAIFEDHPDKFDLYCFRFHLLHQRKESYGDLTLNFGRVIITSKITKEQRDLVFIAAQFGSYDFRCSVKPYSEQMPFDAMEREFFDDLQAIHLVELIRRIDGYFGEKYYSLKDMFFEERLKIISTLTGESIKKISEVNEQLYEQNRRMNEVYRSINLPIPEEIRYAVEYTLTKQLQAAVMQLARENFAARKLVSVIRIMEVAKSFHIEPRKDKFVGFLSQELARRIKSLLQGLEKSLIEECSNILKLAKKMGIQLQEREAQDYLFILLKEWRDDHNKFVSLPQDVVNQVFELATYLNINPIVFSKQTV